MFDASEDEAEYQGGPNGHVGHDGGGDDDDDDFSEAHGHFATPAGSNAGDDEHVIGGCAAAPAPTERWGPHPLYVGAAPPPLTKSDRRCYHSLEKVTMTMTTSLV